MKSGREESGTGSPVQGRRNPDTTTCTTQVQSDTSRQRDRCRPKMPAREGADNRGGEAGTGKRGCFLIGRERPLTGMRDGGRELPRKAEGYRGPDIRAKFGLATRRLRSESTLTWPRHGTGRRQNKVIPGPQGRAMVDRICRRTEKRTPRNRQSAQVSLDIRRQRRRNESRIPAQQHRVGEEDTPLQRTLWKTSHRGHCQRSSRRHSRVLSERQRARIVRRQGMKQLREGGINSAQKAKSLCRGRCERPETRDRN